MTSPLQRCLGIFAVGQVNNSWMAGDIYSFDGTKMGFNGHANIRTTTKYDHTTRGHLLYIVIRQRSNVCRIDIYNIYDTNRRIQKAVWMEQEMLLCGLLQMRRMIVVKS